ncbi:hypothetical protein SGLAM104S_05917 [Streptomyces glaucescens]
MTACSPGSGMPRAERRPRLPRALPAIVAAAFVLLHVFGYPATRFSNDSYRYARQAYEFLGDSPPDATRKAVAAYCTDTAGLVHRNRMLDQLRYREPGREAAYAARCERKYAHGLEPTDPRYERIFHTRPGYPFVAAPFVALLGAKAGDSRWSRSPSRRSPGTSCTCCCARCARRPRPRCSARPSAT